MLISTSRPVEEKRKQKKLAPFLRAAIEVGFIIFLFYSNLLMGEFTNSGPGRILGLAWAVQDIFTRTNFAIALLLAAIGHFGFEFIRKRM